MREDQGKDILQLLDSNKVFFDSKTFLSALYLDFPYTLVYDLVIMNF